MATYAIQLPGGQVSEQRMSALAEAVKDAHARVTGAPRDLTQVSVLEIASACFWRHGTPLECHQIFVHGFVAGDTGRPAAALRDAVAAAVASAADFDLGSVVVTISEVDAEKMKPAAALAS